MYSDPVRPNHLNVIDGAGLTEKAAVVSGSGSMMEATAQRTTIGDTEIYATEDIVDEIADAANEELEAEEEAEERKVLPTPTLPSPAEVDQHRIDHYPYRAWCRECVEGRGRERPHFRQHDKRRMPTVVFDYCFLSKQGVYSRSEWATMPPDAEGAKILVVREIVSKCVFAHVVKSKGVGEDRYAVDCLVRDVEWMGHTKVMLRSDNERAIVALLKETLKSLRIDTSIEQVSEEHPPEYDPQANGAIESTVGAFKGLLRTMVLALENRIGHRIPPDHPAIAWLAPHCAWTLTIRVRGDDGKTAYQRVRLKPFSTRMLEFGEHCRYKINRPEMKNAGTMTAKWDRGVFLGICKMTGRYRIWTGEGVSAARTVVRLPDVEKWSMEKIAGVTQRPHQLHENSEPQVVFREPADAQAETAAEAPLQIARRLYIKKSDVEMFGYTQGCPKCNHDLQYGFGRTTKGHSNACRARITAKLMETEAGRARIAAATGRIDGYLSEVVQRADNKGDPAQGEKSDDSVRRPPNPENLGNGFEPIEPQPPATVEDLLREEAIEVTRNAPLWEPGTALYQQQPTVENATMGEPPMETEDAPMEVVERGRKKRNFIGPLKLGHRQHRKLKQLKVSYLDWAPVPDEASPQEQHDQDAQRQPALAKHQCPEDGDIFGIEEISQEWETADREEALRLQHEIAQMINTIGGDVKQYSKEAKAARIVSEIYSAPRVTRVAKMIPSLGVLPGFALDLSVNDKDGKAWDFDHQERREAARKLLDEEQPMLVIGSPMCTEFCLLLNLSKAKRDPAVVAAKLRRARDHLTFCMEIYKYQMDRGKYFLHEHPLTATSWDMPETLKISSLPGVDRVTCHQCQYGAEDENGNPHQESHAMDVQQRSHT